MGRDIERWGRDATIYLVARAPVELSCDHPVIRFYALGVDVRDARDISQYVPSQDPSRPVVCYLLPDMTDAAALITSAHPDAERRDFRDNIGQIVFTRLVIHPATGHVEPPREPLSLGRARARAKLGLPRHVS
jgi:hypothetical protein